ncbi:hypothetical protein NPIL_297151 [Nephila pilipes]|uniref:Uncharacterized protein n=1 Tax=Nephila pilipes TaxID=299642 RepID=A0A8X6QM07_NEPPI|nr:hypothetical protein NPIL_297151 [Nephila pilipes]
MIGTGPNAGNQSIEFRSALNGIFVCYTERSKVKVCISPLPLAIPHFSQELRHRSTRNRSVSFQRIPFCSQRYELALNTPDSG